MVRGKGEWLFCDKEIVASGLGVYQTRACFVSTEHNPLARSVPDTGGKKKGQTRSSLPEPQHLKSAQLITSVNAELAVSALFAESAPENVIV